MITVIADDGINPPVSHKFSVDINAAPTVSITSGPAGTVATSTVTFTWQGQDTDGTIQRYEYKMDGVAASTTDSNQTFSNLSESSHTFEVRAQDDDGSYSSWASRTFSSVVLKDFLLEQNYPNPFNPGTTIPVAIPFESEVNLSVYNSLGQKVKSLYSGTLRAGRYLYKWDGRDENGKQVSSGIYLYRLRTSKNVTFSGKMVLSR